MISQNARARVLRASMLAVLLCAALFSRTGDTQDTGSPGEFFTHLERVTQRQTLRDLNVGAAVIDLLASGDADSAVRQLSELAARGDLRANVALVRVQRWCARVVSSPTTTDPAFQDRIRSTLDAQQAARAVALIDAQVEFLKRAQTSCRAATFDLRGIDALLRDGAAKGDLVSATELARFTNDAARREALLVLAAEKGYAPAQHALASSRVAAVQRGLSTENVASIRILLKQAGQTLSAAKLDFANCVALGCDGHPSDAATAAVFGIDAARDGEAGAFPAILRMPWRARLAPEEIVAWQLFGKQLNEAGCMGEAYVTTALNLAQAMTQLEKGLRPDVVSAGRQLAEKYWADYGDRAKREQLCEERH